MVVSRAERKCHNLPIENVTLTPKEQTRLQVLNSPPAEHIEVDQAATLMGVSAPTLRWTHYLDRIRAELSENPGSPASDSNPSPGEHLLPLDSPTTVPCSSWNTSAGVR